MATPQQPSEHVHDHEVQELKKIKDLKDLKQEELVILHSILTILTQRRLTICYMAFIMTIYFAARLLGVD